MTVPPTYFVSVVARLHNDLDLLEPFVCNTLQVLREAFQHYELILVDDGSEDGTRAEVALLRERVEGFRYLQLSQRCGQDVALTAGIESAIGDFVVTVSPRTDHPALIPPMVRLAHEQDAIVYGSDPQRQAHRPLRRLSGHLFYWCCRHLVSVRVLPHATYFLVLNRKAVTAMMTVKDRFKYLRSLLANLGYKTLPYRYGAVRDPHREAWFFETLEAAISVIVSNSLRPLRFVSLVGVVTSGCNAVYIGYILSVMALKRDVAPGWVTLSLQQTCMFLLLFLAIAVLSEYIGRILNEAQDHPVYYVQEEFASAVAHPDAGLGNIVRGSE